MTSSSLRAIRVNNAKKQEIHVMNLKVMVTAPAKLIVIGRAAVILCGRRGDKAANKEVIKA